MNLKLSLRASLIAAFGASLLLVGFAQLATRYFFQLPELYQQEYANDVEAVRQVQHALQLEVSRKESIAYDNAWWNKAYEFMRSDAQSAFYSEFVAEEYEFVETMHTVPQIDGYSYLQLDGRVHFSSVHDHESLESRQVLRVPLTKIIPLLQSEHGAVLSGFITGDSGPAVFVLAEVTNDEATIPPSGYLAIWRSADDAFFQEVTGSGNVRFTLFDPEADRDLAAAIGKNQHGVLPRNAESESRWILEDVFGNPLFTVTQQLPPRNFDDGIVSIGSLVGLLTIMLLLAAFSAVISRRIVGPIEQLTDFLRSVARSEDFSRRLPLERHDEIGVVARYFDRLLDVVESQDRELREKNISLAKLADHDSLTGVYNRRVFDRVLSR
ncbi:MAG: CHASE4 domain-containing protein, partial [Pseudomonadota bacterium]